MIRINLLPNELQQAARTPVKLFVTIIIGIVVAMLGWKFFDMKKLLQEPRIEVH